MSPSKQEKRFDVSYAPKLLEIAKGDLKSAVTLSIPDSGRIENAFFMVQQAIEKCLKAVIVKSSIPVPLVHDLGILIAVVPRHIEPPYGYELNSLSEYAAIKRYEEGEWKPTLEELSRVLEMGREMIVWAENIVREI